MVLSPTPHPVLKVWLLLGFLSPCLGYADAKNFLVSLPVLTLGREGSIRAECNLFEKGTLALEWTEWVGKGQREELTNQEMKDNPGSSLRTEGRELGLMFGRYTDPLNMGGFNWGVGLGYRTIKADWLKAASAHALNKEPGSRYDAKAIGPAISGRLGYRFVGESVGFAIGGFLGAKHFLSQVSDESSEDKPFFTPIPVKDRSVLKKKLSTSLKIGIEIGWAF